MKLRVANSVLSISSINGLKTKLESIDIVVIDEISMISKYDIELIDYVIRQSTGLMNCIFGGKLVLIFGDIFQLPPVTKNNPICLGPLITLSYVLKSNNQ